MKETFAASSFAAHSFASGSLAGAGISAEADTEAVMATVDYVYTYRDLIQHLLDGAGGVGFTAQERRLRTAIQQAMRAVMGAHNWQYLWHPIAILFNAPYSTGTVAYDHTGGTYERQLTLTSGTWPTWAKYAHIRIGNSFYQVDERMTSTVITLRENSNPADDLASGTTYTLYQSRYALPTDFLEATDWQVDGITTPIKHIPQRQWHVYERALANSGTPQVWSTLPEINNPSRSAVVVYPYPSSAIRMGALYKRTPRQLRLDGYNSQEIAGTLTVAAGSTSVAGTSTTFVQAHKGAMLRVYDGTNYPDGAEGEYPYYEQRIIREVTSATALRLESGFSGTYTSVKYRISDPIDVAPHMVNALYAAAEYFFAVNTGSDSVNKKRAQYEKALQEAKDSDPPNNEESGYGGLYDGFQNSVQVSL